MGAYLSTPVTDKKSQDLIESKKYECGLSGMQGWRISMEDSYNCEPQIDEDTGFFAVYDGHGGGEVAMYCSHHFVEILKSMEAYKNDDFTSALSQTFMEVDRKLKNPKVIKELKLLSQMDPGDPPVTQEDIDKMEKQEAEDMEDEADETRLLHEEATMSIEDLLAKYGRVVNNTEEKMKEVMKETSSGSSAQEHKDGGDKISEKSDKTKGDEETNPPASNNENTVKEKNSEEKSDVTKKDQSEKDVHKILRKTFLKSKPVKVEEDDESEDDDYEGFESDEAVEGSSDEDEESDDDDEEESEEDEAEDSPWGQEKNDEEGKIGMSGSEEPGCDSGTTAVVALLRDTDLYVANAGDSRCVLSRKGGIAFDMSDDHKPEDEAELARITNAGGHVNVQGRVNGGLNLSRALGDHLYKTNADLPLEKQMITALPDVRHVSLEPGDEFMVIACDGIWNVLNSQEVVDFVRSRLNFDSQSEDKKEMKLSEICEELFHRCLADDTSGDGTGCDNMTCIIVRFKQEWLLQRHHANNSSPSAVPEHSCHKPSSTDDVTVLAKGDSNETNNGLNMKSTNETNAEKRPLAVANDSPACINGESNPAKRTKVD